MIKKTIKKIKKKMKTMEHWRTFFAAGAACIQTATFLLQIIILLHIVGYF